MKTLAQLVPVPFKLQVLGMRLIQLLRQAESKALQDRLYLLEGVPYTLDEAVVLHLFEVEL